MREIVIIEDDMLLAESVRRSLQNSETKVVCYSDPPEFEILEENPPDLLILDCFLGTSSGPDYLKMLRQHPRFQKTPVLLITGFDELADVLQDSDLKNCEVLRKPFDIGQLKTAISSLT